ncbi:hypothetical protein CPC08DRAFT_771843 [Agrocybe pediades]|nr:hypothetical protein CPC08DRAFT_771843 [Agrocybe pediades]
MATVSSRQRDDAPCRRRRTTLSAAVRAMGLRRANTPATTTLGNRSRRGGQGVERRHRGHHLVCDDDDHHRRCGRPLRQEPPGPGCLNDDTDSPVTPSIAVTTRQWKRRRGAAGGAGEGVVGAEEDSAGSGSRWERGRAGWRWCKIGGTERKRRRERGHQYLGSRRPRPPSLFFVLFYFYFF